MNRLHTIHEGVERGGGGEERRTIMLISAARGIYGAETREKNAGMTMIGDGSAKCGKARKCKSGMTWREH